MNALELKHMLTGKIVKAPKVLVEHYPKVAGYHRGDLKNGERKRKG